jgi:hypothetical protein
LQAAAKMGAVFSVAAAIVAFALKKILRVGTEAVEPSPEGATLTVDTAEQDMLTSLESTQEAMQEALDSGTPEVDSPRSERS